MHLELGEKKMSKFPKDKDLERMRNSLNEGVASKPLAKNASAIDKLKFRLCEKFVIYKNTHKITQRALAQKLSIDEALMSKILHYNYEEFTVDRLVKFLSTIYPNIDLNIDVAS